MRAIVQTGYGSLDRLEMRDVPMPAVGPHDVLVRVRAASVHPDVWHVVMGRPLVLRAMGAGLRRPNPPIPGTDMAGVVVEVGSDVTGVRPGDAMFGETIASHQWVHGGAFAEHVAVRQDLLVHKPENVTFEQAASVPASGYIALLNLGDLELLRPGQAALVNGAGGGVGMLTLQILKSRGMQVTAVDRSVKLDMLRRLGADDVLDGTQVDFTASDKRYDLLVDIPGNHSVKACSRVLTAGGRYVLIGHEQFGASGKRLFGLIPKFLTLMARARFDPRLRGFGGSLPSKATVMTVLRDLLASGQITPVIDSTYPLEDVRQAFRRLMDPTTCGKVVLVM